MRHNHFNNRDYHNNHGYEVVLGANTIPMLHRAPYLIRRMHARNLIVAQPQPLQILLAHHDRQYFVMIY